MIATLEALIAPLNEAEFLDRLRRRELFLQRGEDSARFAGLIDWPALRSVILSGNHPLEEIRVQRETAKVAPLLYAEQGRIVPAKLDALLHAGVSVIVEAFEQHIPALDALCRAIGARIGERVLVNAFVSTGPGGALRTHYDEEDALMLQIEGSKRWQVYGPAVADPVKGMTKRAPPGGPPILDKVLESGDLLFLPAGHWHHCENGPGRSLHLVVAFVPPVALYALRVLVQQLAEDPLFRRPFTRLASDEERSALEAAVKSRLAERLAALSLGPLAAAMRDSEEHSLRAILEGLGGAT